MANYYVSSVAYTAVPIWTALATLAVGAFRRQVSPTIGNERVFKVTAITTGITGASEPAWNLTYGTTTTDAGVTWTCRGGQEADQSAGNWTAPMARMSQLPGNTNAQTSHPIVAGDTVFLSSDHAETQTGVYTAGTSTFSITMLSVSRTGATLPPTSTDLLRGASVTTTSTSGNQNLSWADAYVWGVDFFAATLLLHSSNGNGTTELDNCSSQTTGSGGSYAIYVGNSGTSLTRWKNSFVKFSNAAGQIILPGNTPFEWIDTNPAGSKVSAFQGTVPTVAIRTGARNVALLLFEGLDLSSLTGTIFSPSNNPGMNDVRFRDCKINNSVTLWPQGPTVQAVTPNAQIMFDNCDDSTNDRNYRMARATPGGLLQTSTALVRAGGNTDGTTLFSWQMINNNNQLPTILALGNPIQFQEIAQRYNTTGSSKTATLYGISSFSAIPTNANMWIDVQYLGSSASPIASGVSSRVADALAAPANLTADTSSWNGNVSARQNSFAYSVGALMSVADNAAGCTFICTASSGNSASSEPAGYAACVDGGTVTDGSCTFMAMWRWKIVSPSFTPQVAGTIKVIPRTRLIASMSATANLLVIDPQFVLT